MNTFLITFESVLILLCIGLLGFWIISRKLIPAQVISVISPLVIEISVPCLVFSSIIIGFDPVKQPDWWMLPLWWLGFTIVNFILTKITSLISNKKYRKEFSASLFFQNGMFVPLAIITGLYGLQSKYTNDLFIFAIVYPAFFFNFYQYFFRDSMGNGVVINWDKIKNPVLIATLLAIGLKLTGTHVFVPDFITKTCQVIGKMTIPLIFLIIGGSIYIDFQEKGEIHLMEIVKFISLKNILFPLITIAIIWYFRPPENVALILLLQSAGPPLTAVPIVAERAKGNRIIANQLLIASLIVCSITIPAMMVIYNYLFK